MQVNAPLLLAVLLRRVHGDDLRRHRRGEDDVTAVGGERSMTQSRADWQRATHALVRHGAVETRAARAAAGVLLMLRARRVLEARAPAAATTRACCRPLLVLRNDSNDTSVLLGFNVTR